MNRRGDLDDQHAIYLTVESDEELSACPAFVVEVIMEAGGGGDVERRGVGSVEGLKRR